MRKLHNPVESLDNVEPSEKRREHGTRVRDLLDERSLDALAEVRSRAKAAKR